MGLRTVTRKYKCLVCRYEWVQTVGAHELERFLKCPNCEARCGDVLHEAYGKLELTACTEDVKLLQWALAERVASLAQALFESIPMTKLLEHGYDSMTITLSIGGQHDPGSQWDDEQRKVHSS
jgi:hypothetical protein